MNHDLKKSLYEYFNSKQNRTEQEEEFLAHFKGELDFYDVPYVQLSGEDLKFKGYTLFGNENIEEIANNMNDYLIEEFFFAMESSCSNLHIPHVSDIIDRDIYSIYEDSDGVKWFHWEGYFYNGDDTYLRYEPVGCVFPLSDILVANDVNDSIRRLLDEWASVGKSGIEEIEGEYEAADTLCHFHNGQPPKRLEFSNLSMDTPCGCYINY